MRKRSILIILALLFSVGGSVLGAGILIPGDVPGSTEIFHPQDTFSIKSHKIEVAIKNQVATTHVDEVFHNETSNRLEATYVFPLPAGAVVSDFAMYIGKERVKGEILAREKAVEVYEGIVRRQKDPALLEYLGKGLFRTRVWPVEPGEDKRIQLSYSQVNPRDGAAYKYVYPLGTEKFSAKPARGTVITIELTADQPIGNIYSPTHNVSVRKIDARTALVSYEEGGEPANTDLVLYYTLSGGKVGLDVMSYCQPGKAGYFLLLASPQPKLTDKKPVAKDVIFVLDHSGSMAGEKIRQAKDALEFCINSLNPEDRFDVVAFDEQIDHLTDAPVPASSENVSKGLAFVRKMEAQGSTDIDTAMKTALGMMPSDKRPKIIVFLTDGQPTTGETNADKILANVRKANDARTRVFVFGVGYDVNTHFLDRMAEASGALSDYVRPSDNIEAKVSSFFAKVKKPAISDLTLKITGAKVDRLYPDGDLPDLYEGSQLVILGRYADSGSATITLTGRSGDEALSYTRKIELPDDETENDFVPRLWAARRIGYLTDKIRLEGKSALSKELIDEVIALSKEFGIVTEYTAALVQEPGMKADGNLRRAFAAPSAPPAVMYDMSVSGSAAVSKAQNSASLRSQAQVYQNSFFDKDGNRVSMNQMQRIGKVTFFQNGSQWVDMKYDLAKPTQKLTQIKLYSNAYFQVVKARPELARYFAQGSDVIVTVGKNAIQAGKDGKTDLTPAELKALLGI